MPTWGQARRQLGVQEACQKEVQLYEEKRVEIQDSILAAETEINLARHALQQAQLVRRHEEEYEARE